MNWYVISQKWSSDRFLFGNHGFQASMSKCTLSTELDKWMLTTKGPIECVPNDCHSVCEFKIGISNTDDYRSLRDSFTGDYNITELGD